MFEAKLRDLLNECSIENECDTPDFILADYIRGCLDAFNVATKNRDQWHGFVPFGRKTGNPVTDIFYGVNDYDLKYTYTYCLNGVKHCVTVPQTLVVLLGHERAFLEYTGKHQMVIPPAPRRFISGPHREDSQQARTGTLHSG